MGNVLQMREMVSLSVKSKKKKICTSHEGDGQSLLNLKKYVLHMRELLSSDAHFHLSPVID